MKKLSILCLFMVGCATSPKIAQEALDKGQRANQQVTRAFFIKSWGLNRSLSTEAREKWIAQTQLNILRQANNGNISIADTDKLIENLNNQLGQDEIVLSSNFAYLSFLLQSSETAQGYLDIVDYFVESSKPTVEHLLKSRKENINETTDELASWESIIGNLKDQIPKFIKNVVE